MACCIAIAFVIGVVRKVWFRLFPSRERAELLFAPVASRPAPGSDSGRVPGLSRGVDTPSAQPESGRQARRVLLPALILVALLGVAASMLWPHLTGSPEHHHMGGM